MAEQFQRVKVRVDRDRVVPTIITASDAVAVEWIHKMKSLFDEDRPIRRCHLIVGLDIELATAQPPRIATVQFGIAQHCLIYRSIMAAEPLPLSLRRLLLDYENNVFVGVGLQYKLGILRQELGFGDEDRVPYIELREHAARVYPNLGLMNAGRLQVADAVLPSRWGVVRSVADGNWDAPELSYADVEYACSGAFISRQIALKLLNATLIRSELNICV